MSEDEAIKFSTSNPNKLDLILLTLQRIQEDLEMAKCQIKTSMSELANQQNYRMSRYLNSSAAIVISMNVSTALN